MSTPRPLFFLLIAAGLNAFLPSSSGQTAESALDRYFEQQVTLLEGQVDRADIRQDTWDAQRKAWRQELAEMLGLDPLPARTDLKATKTGEFEDGGVVVEKLHFQSRPGLYVTANLYRPREVPTPLPTVLYVCGHSSMMKNGVSYGNKAGYEHHGTWYARHGFICLIIDTVQLGEIRGEHHGTYRMGKWWWMGRGYTPAGVETWAGIRALDYLETRPEVDKTRFGVAGRSGGGAYSWFVAAMDERIRCAVPTAGITTLRNHVVDGCVSGHCDCMFFVNTHRWDYDKLAALVAPRPLLVTNTDKDSIFPVDGVFNIYQATRRVYEKLGALPKIGLHVAEGPHKDMQPLNTGEFHWMRRHLQGADLMDTVAEPAVKSLPMEKLQVFATLPADEINTRADEEFVLGAPGLDASLTADTWATRRNTAMKALETRCFPGWRGLEALPVQVGEPSATSRQGVTVTTWNLSPGGDASVWGSGKLHLLHGERWRLEDLELVVLNVLDEEGCEDLKRTFGHIFPEALGKAGMPDETAFTQEQKMLSSMKWGMAYYSPRGVADGALSLDEKTRTHQLRRFYLLGQTLEGQQVWDIRQAIHSLREQKELPDVKIWIQASRKQAANVVYASLFEEGITRLDLHQLPPDHRNGPIYLNVQKHLDLPQAVAMAAERTRVVIYANDPTPWKPVQALSERLQWGREKKAGLQLRDVPQSQAEK